MSGARTMTDWQLQDAKNRFGAVVDAALSGFPQRVTRRGKPAVVVLSVDEYERLCQLERAQAPTLPEVLLTIPQDRGSIGCRFPSALSCPDVSDRYRRAVCIASTRTARQDRAMDVESTGR